jgi:PBP1b-binding outer membrane lipoprotein LpoB
MMKLKTQISTLTSALLISGCVTSSDSKLMKMQNELNQSRIQKNALETKIKKSNETILQLTHLNRQLQSATASPVSNHQLELTNAEHVNTTNGVLSAEAPPLTPTNATIDKCYARILMPITAASTEQQEAVSTEQQEAVSFLHWHAILCSINTTPIIVRKLQQALLAAGYNPGMIDGIIGSSTVRAITSYQKKNNLAVGQITIDTLKSLGINKNN